MTDPFKTALSGTDKTALSGSIKKGALYVVATPIGNLGDITARALEVLAQVSQVMAEDTRNTQKLLQHFAIDQHCVSLHDHNERARIEQVAGWLSSGQSLALVSDAGTPLISDPGYPLVASLRQQGFPVIPIPGVSAIIAALSVAGLPTDRFAFEGFIPPKGKAREDRIGQLSSDSRTLVFYEAPHRILDLVQRLTVQFGDIRQAVLCRELTKTFETVHSAPLGELASWIAEDVNQQKGEIVLLVAGNPKVSKQDDLSVNEQRLLQLLLKELPLKKAAQLAAEYTGKSRKMFYQYGLNIKEG